jgi:hypothetical protein
MDAKTLLEVGRTIPCTVIFHLTVLRPENALIHAIVRNMPSFLYVHRNLPFSRGIKENGRPQTKGDRLGIAVTGAINWRLGQVMSSE